MPDGFRQPSLRRRITPRPASPTPRTASVAGSGTGPGPGVTTTSCGVVKNSAKMLSSLLGLIVWKVIEVSHVFRNALGSSLLPSDRSYSSSSPAPPAQDEFGLAGLSPKPPTVISEPLAFVKLPSSLPPAQLVRRRSVGCVFVDTSISETWPVLL